MNYKHQKFPGKINVSTHALHIVSFDIPYFPDYGGIIDVFYKIKELKKAGVDIYLHCFQYNNKESRDELEKLCEKVFYYKRHTGIKLIFSSLPYIVKSRQNKQLLHNLLADNYPILFEGLHTTAFLRHKQLTDRIKIVRTHNIEHQYYYHLSSAERNPIKKLYFRIEAVKLKYYEPILKKAGAVAAISKPDWKYFKKYGKAYHVPAFHPVSKTTATPGRGIHILYHGNLQIAENNKAVTMLITSVFSQINHQVIIAGKNPSGKLQRMVADYRNIKLIANPKDETMNRLIADSHIITLFTFQDTGIKLKLLSSLYAGKFCIVNSLMVNNTGLEDLCIVRNKAEDIIEAINRYFTTDFTTQMIEDRRKILSANFSNQQNVKTLLTLFNTI